MAVLVCMVYVDLNPIRAGIATTPEESRFTSAYERIHAHSQHALKQVAPDSQAVVARPSLCCQSKRHAGNDDWLSPIRGPAEPPLSVTGRRAANDPCLVMSLAEYLQLLDWTGRQVHADNKGSIPAHLAPILERVSLEASHWVDLIQNFGNYFRREFGTPQHLAEEAVRQGRYWLQGISHARQVCCSGGPQRQILLSQPRMVVSAACATAQTICTRSAACSSKPPPLPPGFGKSQSPTS